MSIEVPKVAVPVRDWRGGGHPRTLLLIGTNSEANEALRRKLQRRAHVSSSLSNVSTLALKESCDRDTGATPMLRTAIAAERTPDATPGACRTALEPSAARGERQSLQCAANWNEVQAHIRKNDALSPTAKGAGRVQYVENPVSHSVVGDRTISFPRATPTPLNTFHQRPPPSAVVSGARRGTGAGSQLVEQEANGQMKDFVIDMKALAELLAQQQGARSTPAAGVVIARQRRGRRAAPVRDLHSTVSRSTPNLIAKTDSANSRAVSFACSSTPVAGQSIEVRPAFRKSRTAGVITWAEERQADELHVEGSRVFSEIPSDFRSVGRSSFALEGSEWELEGGGERTDSAFAGTATCVATQPSVRWVESEIGTRVSSPSRVKSAKSERSMLARSAVATRRVSTGCSTTAALASDGTRMAFSALDHFEGRPIPDCFQPPDENIEKRDAKFKRLNRSQIDIHKIFGRRAEAGSRSNVPSRLFHDPQSVPSTSNPTPDLVSATALARPDSTSTPGIDEADFDGISRSPNVIGGEGGAKEGEQALGRTSGIEDLLREAYEMRSAAIERPLSRLDRSRLKEQEAARMERLSRIGPHVDIWKTFHQRDEARLKGPTPQQKHAATLTLQRYVRGWLVRKQIERLRRKALLHAPSLAAFTRHYYCTIKRIMKHFGVRHTQKIEFNTRHMEKFLDEKQRFEIAFSNVEFGGVIQESELMPLLHSCGRYPSESELKAAKRKAFAEEYYSEERGRTLSADDVVEIVMHIYVPEGALRAGVRSGRKSTWLNPVVDGVEAVRLLHEPLVSRNRQEDRSTEKTPDEPLSHFFAYVVARRLEREPQTDLARKRLWMAHLNEMREVEERVRRAEEQRRRKEQLAEQRRRQRALAEFYSRLPGEHRPSAASHSAGGAGGVGGSAIGSGSQFSTHGSGAGDEADIE